MLFGIRTFILVFNTFLFPAIAGVRLLVRFLRIQMGSENHVGGSFVNKILYWVFSTEIKLLSYTNFPFGVSILLIAKKTT
jgi:hypothetical protein